MRRTETSMSYIQSTDKSFSEAVRDLQHAVSDHGFGVLHQYDFQQVLAARGYPIGDACMVLEICQPELASEVLNADMRVNLALPCRMSVFTRDGQTWIGMLSPEQLLALVPTDADIGEVAHAVEQTARRIIDDAV